MPATPKTRTPKADAKAVASLGENELCGLFSEAFESYDMQDDRSRFDTLGRKWVFRPDKLNDHSILSLRLERLQDVAEDHISTHILGSDLGKPMIEDVIRKLDGKLA